MFTCCYAMPLMSRTLQLRTCTLLRAHAPARCTHSFSQAHWSRRSLECYSQRCWYCIFACVWFCVLAAGLSVFASSARTSAFDFWGRKDNRICVGAYTLALMRFICYSHSLCCVLLTLFVTGLAPIWRASCQASAACCVVGMNYFG